MSEILLRTKLFVPPLRPSLVPRPRLLAKLDAGRTGKLALVAAPAGFGKTTLVVDWLQTQNQPVAWLSLDENDNEPLRFFSYLLAAIQTIDNNLAANLAAGLHSANPPDETAVMPALLNELSAQQTSFILVLDDYHTITHEAIHTAVAFFLDHLPPNLHLVITSRDTPPLPLPRWRVRGQLTDINAVDLRFSTPEAQLFLHDTMDLTLDETAISTDSVQAVAILVERTEGWVAGLQLAALSLRNGRDNERFITEFVGSERQVADYLLQEVLLQQPVHIQQFLLKTAVLERFNAALCDALLDQTNSQDVLDELEQNNLFIIPLDNSRYWYRYHHLFAELLLYRLQRDFSDTAVADLHRRASKWYAAQDLREEATSHAFQIPDYDAVAQLINTIPMHYVFGDGGSIQIMQWIEQLPPTLMSTYPYVAMLMAGAALINGQIKITYDYLDLIADDETMQPFKDLFNSILVRNENADHHEALRLAKRSLAGAAGHDLMLAPMAWNQIAVNYFNLGQLEAADEASTQMRLAIRGDETTTITLQLQGIEMQIANAYSLGNLYRAEQFCQEGITIATRDQQARSPLIGIMYTGLANITYQWNDLQQSKVYVNKAMDWAQRTGISDIYTYSAFILANHACRQGDKEALQRALALFTSRFDSRNKTHIHATIERVAAWFWLQIGDLETAVRWANASGLSLDDDPAYHDFDTYYTLVAIRLAECRQLSSQQLLPQLLALINKLESLVITSRHVIGLIEALNLKALILDYQSDATAVPTLQKALDLAKPGSIKRQFLDWGEPMQHLLTKTGYHDPLYVGRLLDAFTGKRETAVVPIIPTTPTPTIKLTVRENEILQLIAAGYSNKQIEETLFISKNTVRTHIKNLYSKLGVASRTQAIHQAHALNLLT